MDLFKIYEGHSSRIGLETTPFDKGAMYFTYDDGGLYVDTEVDGQQKRVRIGASGSEAHPPIYVNISKDNWEGDTQTISVRDITAKHDGVIGLTQDISKEAFTAAKKAELQLIDQQNGQIKIRANETVPEVDIPAVIIITSAIVTGITNWLKV